MIKKTTKILKANSQTQKMKYEKIALELYRTGADQVKKISIAQGQIEGQDQSHYQSST